MRLEQQQINDVSAAVEILRKEGQPITIQKISDLTSIPRGILYQMDVLRPYIRRKLVLRRRPETILRKSEVTPSLGSYILYVQENFFDKPQTIADVKRDMSLEIEEFHPDIFQQVVNLLIKDKVIAPHIALRDTFVKTASAAPQSIATPTNEIIIQINSADDRRIVYIPEDQLDREVNDILHKHPDCVLTVFKPVETIRTEIQIQIVRQQT